MTLTSALCGFDIDELYAVRFDGAPVDGALIVRNCRAVNQGWEAGECKRCIPSIPCGEARLTTVGVAETTEAARAKAERNFIVN